MNTLTNGWCNFPQIATGKYAAHTIQMPWNLLRSPLCTNLLILLVLMNCILIQDVFSEDTAQHIEIASLIKTIPKLEKITFHAEIQTSLSAEIMKNFGVISNAIQFKQVIDGWIDNEKFLYKQIYEGIPNELNDPYYIAFDGKLFQVYKPKASYLYFTSSDSTNATEMAGLGLLLDPYEFLLSQNEILNVEAATLSPRQFKDLLSTLENSSKSFVFEANDKDHFFLRTKAINSQAVSYSYKVTISKKTMLPIAWQKIAEDERVIEDYRVLTWGSVKPNEMSFPASAQKILYSKNGDQLRYETIKIFDVKFGDEISEKPSFTFDFRNASRIHDIDRNLFITPQKGLILDGDALNNN